MKCKSIFEAGFGLLFIVLGASANSVPLTLTSSSYNFQLAGGGGGASATLNGVPVEIFCDDFADNIYIPSNNQADVTTLGTSANLSETRFGGVSSSGWTSITLNDGNSSLDSTDDAFFNSGSGTSSLARYEMVAYLVSLYNTTLGGNTANNEIQEAIWTIMDPKASPQGLINPDNLNPDSYLEEAVSWYSSMNTNQVALNSFLSQFKVISDATMTFSNGLGVGGFQEQIVMTPTPTPEPRGGIWLLLGLMVGGFFVVRRNRAAGEASASA